MDRCQVLIHLQRAERKIFNLLPHHTPEGLIELPNAESRGRLNFAEHSPSEVLPKIEPKLNQPGACVISS